MASPHDNADAQGETSPVELQEARSMQNDGLAVLLSQHEHRSPSTHLRRSSVQDLRASASPQLLSAPQAPREDVRASALPRRDNSLIYTCVKIFEDDAHALQHAPARLTSIRQWADIVTLRSPSPAPERLHPVQAPSQEAEKRQINEKVGHDARIVAQGRETRRNVKFDVSRKNLGGTMVEPPAEPEAITLGDLGLSLGEWLPLSSGLPFCQLAGRIASAHETL
jgi:hypothetical protein